MIERQFGDWFAAAVPESGGNLVRLAWRSKDLLRVPPSEEALAAAPEQYGLPVLFPAGRIDGGRFECGGRIFSLPVNEPERNNHLHGIAYRAKWTAEIPSDTGFVMNFSYGPGSPGFAGFNLPFDLKLEYIFEPGCATQVFTVKNTGSFPLPCSAGFHSMFASVRVIRAEAMDFRWEISQPRFLPTGRKLLWETDFDPRLGICPSGRKISCQFPAPAGPHSVFLDYGDLFLEYRVDEKFRDWCFWNRDGESGFIAAEPMCCRGGGLNPPCPPENGGPRRIAPGAELVFRSVFFPRSAGMDDSDFKD